LMPIVAEGEWTWSNDFVYKKFQDAK